MPRYKNTNIKYIELNSKRKAFNTTLYVSVPEKDTDQYFISQDGDRCDNLAQEFYGNAELWWFIARVNNLKTNNIPPGISLRIPASTDNARGL
tara:strand:+ start:4785 stop:5063 length:279 start_codon:yes stop_codon:yes gene_type:complete